MSSSDDSTIAEDDASFDVLRGQLELCVQRPAVIVVTSSSLTDGKELASLGVAHSLARTGYSALVIDTTPVSQSVEGARPSHALDEVLRSQLPNVSGSKRVPTLKLDDPTLQRSTSQRGVESALQLLRETFDFVLISTSFVTSGSFASSLLASADAVLVTVKTGRRRTADDAQLSLILKRLDSRFMGVVAIDGALIRSNSVPKLDRAEDNTARGETELQRREILRSST